MRLIMRVEELKPGLVETGPKWPELMEIKKVENSGEYVQQHVDQLIPVAEFSQVSVRVIETDFGSEPLKTFLAIETKRYRFASPYDPLLAMNASKVNPLPHQIEAVYSYILKLPRIRFLIADGSRFPRWKQM